MQNGFALTPYDHALIASEAADRIERADATECVIGALQQAIEKIAVQNKGLGLFLDTIVGLEDLIGELEEPK